ncbi:MAG: cytochrome b N-terminal domain-containing protein [Chloroflexi bacterium]|nr:cytochrome b N-terminal domain-containing protein [Chloroflexota bacterium]
MRPSFFHHLHPPTIPAHQARWRHTLGAGGTALFLALILGATGILETFYYVPNPQGAAHSVQLIAYHVPFGWLIRNLHYWSAQLLLIVSALHLLRVIFTAAYAAPRRFNYLLGMGLFFLALLLDFTGYILRWDVDICYPLVTGTNLLKTIPLIGGTLHRLAVGGNEACETALLRFYAWHIFGLTIAAVILAGWHAFRVRRDGGIAAPPSSIRADNARIPRGELVRRETLAMLVVSIALILLSVFFPAPIAPAMTGRPTLTAEARAPWFFLWVQEMLKWGDPFAFGILIPFSIFMFVALVPYLFPKIDPAEIGGWFPKSNRLVQILVAAMVLFILILTFLNR